MAHIMAQQMTPYCKLSGFLSHYKGFLQQPKACGHHKYYVALDTERQTPVSVVELFGFRHIALRRLYTKLPNC